MCVRGQIDVSNELEGAIEVVGRDLQDRTSSAAAMDTVQQVHMAANASLRMPTRAHVS